MATKPMTVDDLFPSGTPPEAAPTAQEIESASRPAFYPRAGSGPAAPTSPTVDDLFPSGSTPEPGVADMAGSAAKGAVAGAFRDAPVVAGAMAGFKAGMPLALKTAPALGPFAGAIPLVTTLGGAFMGYQAGQLAESVIPGETDPRLVPYREGGKTFGSSIATAPAAFFLPVAGPTSGRIATFISGMGETARRSPKVFMGTEALGAGAMGVAGGTAEAFRPGQEGVRLASELGAGVAANLGATKLLLTGVDLTKRALATARSGFSNRTTKLERDATNLLFDALEKAGEDPNAIIKALRTQLPSSVPTPTAGQKTGSQALMNLEASLGNHRAEFGGETIEQGKQASLAYQALLEKLKENGSPAALRAVAELQQTRFDNMLETRLDLANKRAANAIARISTDTPEARKQIGQLVKNETELALREARDVESQLWTTTLENMTRATKQPFDQMVVVGINPFSGKEMKRAIPSTRVVAPSLTPSNTIDNFLERASSMGPALFDNIPPQVRKIMDSFGVDEDAVNRFRNGKLTEVYLDTGKVPGNALPKTRDQPIQDLVNYRSTLLGMARDAAGAGKSAEANFYSSMADSMLQDLDKIQDPMFAQARQFSKSLNDVFTRTYANTVTGVTKTGRDRVPPETLVATAFGGGADQTALRMQEIEDAVSFIRTQYRNIVKEFGKDSPQAVQLRPLAQAATTNVNSVRDAHMRVLRLAAADAVRTVYDQKTGTYVQQLNYDALTKFAQKNYGLLEKMGLTREFRDAAHASNLLTQVTNENSALSKAVKNQSAFAQLLTAQEPTKVVTEALNGRFPVKSINNFVDLAKKGAKDASGRVIVSSADAMDGLKSTLYDYAYTKANGFKGTFSPDAYFSALFDPLGRNQPSLVNIMRSNGMMTLQEMVNIKKLLTPMIRIETAIKNNIPYEDVIQGADAVTDLGLRVVGAKIGTAASSAVGGGGQSLVAAAAGSKAIRQIFDSLPNATVRAILENAVKDPQAMAILLQKGRTDREKMDIANEVINLLGSLGVSVGKGAVTPALNYIETDEPRPPMPRAPAGPPASQQLRRLPPAPGTRGVPGFGQQSSAAPAGGGGAPATDSRAMFQQLFPFDSISAMAAQAAPQPPQG